MRAPATGPLRLARAGAAAAVTVALAALAHVVADGELPALVVTLTLTAVVLAAAVALTGRRLGALGAVGLLAVGQLAVHASSTLFTSMACLPGESAPTHVHHPGMVMAPACTAVDAALVAPVLGLPAMLVLHVVATLVTALVLVGVDRALWWLAAWLRPLVGGPAAVPVVAARAALPTPADVPGPAHAWWRDVVPLRGPPAWQSRSLPPR
ncbi:hypothetical protein [uncultured Cellulomonas sp.]|uniref:hypothetical protein n=1 Tax=uncultured Cellulomonas sp. TaxID=189682 RepID=UPI0028E246EB|nr:hypothetical protein [uncultured Cellulomonas sp.]